MDRETLLKLNYPALPKKKGTAVEIIPTLLKYGFVLAVAIELLLIVRAIVRLAREKARAGDTTSSTSGE